MNPDANARVWRGTAIDYGPSDNDVSLISLVEHIKEEREHRVEQIVQSEKGIEESRKLIARIDRLLSAKK